MRPPTVESVGSRGLIFRLLIVAILAPLSGCYSLRSMPAGVGFAAPIGGGAKPFFDPPGSVFRHNPDGLETGRGHAPVAGIDGYRVEAPKAKGGHTWQTTGKKSQKNIYIGGAIGGIVGGVLGASHCSKYDDGSSSGGFPRSLWTCCYCPRSVRARGWDRWSPSRGGHRGDSLQESVARLTCRDRRSSRPLVCSPYRQRPPLTSFR